MSKTKNNKSFDQLFNPRIPFLFLASAIFLAVMGNMACDLLKVYFGDGPMKLWCYFGIAVIGIGFLFLLLRATGYFGAMFQVRSEYRIIDKQHPQPRKGLIAFVSLNQTDHVNHAISYHKIMLEHVWLIATPKSQPTAAQVITENDGSAVRFSLISLQEEWDIIKAKETINKIYNEQLDGLTEEDIIADFTGGTKPMTVGMIFACLAPTRALQYVPADYGKDGAISPRDPIEYKLDTGMIGSLFRDAN
jgi:hypothetical protein